MSYVRIGFYTLFSVLILLQSISCSNVKSPAETSFESSSEIANIPLEGTEVNPSNRAPIAIYDAVIDPISKTFSVTPSARDAQFHIALNSLYPNTLQIVGYGWAPNFWADIKLVHPFPGSGIKGYDPRIIAIVPAKPGVSLYYPQVRIGGNNAILLEPDGYTELFDHIDSSIPGNVNPFKAYFKNQPYRVWSDSGVNQETQRWQMSLAGFAGPMVYKLVVDVSTNFPNPPTPVTDNALEPVQISAYASPGLTQFGGESDITIRLLDWQGKDSIGDVVVEAPIFFDGIKPCVYSGQGANPNEFIYKCKIKNEKLVPAGVYKYLVAARDAGTNIKMYNEFTVTVAHITNDGFLKWAKKAGGLLNDKSVGITKLSDNSVVITGYFYNSAIFGQGEPNETELISNGGDDIFIARYDQDGTLIWAKGAGGFSSYETGLAVTSLGDNSVVVTGYFSSLNAIFGKGEPNQTTLSTKGRYDFFIARYGSDGLLRWAKGLGGTGDDMCWAITTVKDMDVIITGGFYNSVVFGQGEPTETTLTASANEDTFIAYYKANGTFSWARKASSSGFSSGWGVSTLSDNSVVVTGQFSGSAVFGEGTPNETTLTSDGYTDIFIARYTPSGSLNWAKQAGGPGRHDVSRGITSLSDDKTVISGFFEDICTFGKGEVNQTILSSKGPRDSYIANYNPNGSLNWVRSDGGTATDMAFGITRLSNDSIVFIGSFTDLATFGFGQPKETVLYSRSGYREDIFVARYDKNGFLQWAKSAGGESECDFGTDIIALNDNTTIATGRFDTSAIFGLGEPNETSLDAFGNNDIFLARFEP